MVSLEPERTEDLQGTGLQTLPRTQLAGEDHREGTTDCKLTEDKEDIPRTDPEFTQSQTWCGTAGELYED